MDYQGTPRHRDQLSSGEEAVGAIFDRSKGKAKRNEDADEGPSDRSNKKKNQK